MTSFKHILLQNITMRRSNRTTTFYLLKTLAIPNLLLIALSVYKGGFNTFKTKKLVLEIMKETS